MTDYRTTAGDVLDWVCWLVYGETRGTVEAVLDANPGLADQGPVYPAGVLIRLPALGLQAPRPVRLYD